MLVEGVPEGHSSQEWVAFEEFGEPEPMRGFGSCEPQAEVWEGFFPSVVDISEVGFHEPTWEVGASGEGTDDGLECACKEGSV